MLADSFNWEMLFGMPNIIFVLGISVAIVGILAGAWVQVQRQRSLNELKLTLVERGLPAADIERIIRAKPSAAEQDDVADA